MAEALKIDNEFRDLISPLTEYEYKKLEQKIMDEGCRDAIVLWGEIIIDGHNRYKICQEHNIQYKTEQLDFASRDEVINWIIQNQLGRRNLNVFQRVELVHKHEKTVRLRLPN